MKAAGRYVTGKTYSLCVVQQRKCQVLGMQTTLSISSCWGQQAGKLVCRKVCEGQQAEYDPKMCLCGKDQQDSISIALRLTEMALPLSIDREIPKVLGPVLGFPVQETQRHWKVSSEQSLDCSSGASLL